MLNCFHCSFIFCVQSLLQNTDLVNETLVSINALRRIAEVYIDLALTKKDFWLFIKNDPLITTHTTRKQPNNRQTLMYVNMKNVCILLGFLHANACSAQGTHTCEVIFTPVCTSAATRR